MMLLYIIHHIIVHIIVEGTIIVSEGLDLTNRWQLLIEKSTMVKSTDLIKPKPEFLRCYRNLPFSRFWQNGEDTGKFIWGDTMITVFE